MVPVLCYLVGGDSSIMLTELSSLINHLNYLRFRRLRRRSASPSGYTPFISYVHLSCVTFSLFLHERKTRWSGVTIQRTSRGPLKAGSQHSITLNHAGLVLTFHIRWKNSSCSTRILWTGWRKIRGGAMGNIWVSDLIPSLKNAQQWGSLWGSPFACVCISILRACSSHPTLLLYLPTQPPLTFLQTYPTKNATGLSVEEVEPLRHVKAWVAFVTFLIGS